MTCCSPTSTQIAPAQNNVGVTQRPAESRTYRPAADIAEQATGYVLSLDMPGCTPESIDINVTGNELTVTGKVAPRSAADEGILLREYGVGDFARTFRFGPGIDPNNIKAQYKNGVLSLILPKPQQSLPRRINVSQN